MLNFGRLYEVVYGTLCGRHPYQRPWHFQWLAVCYLHNDLRLLLKSYGGVVLDVGCGAKPYKGWFGEIDEYVGIDIADGPEVDICIEGRSDAWPLETDKFDVVLCTQVLEHVQSLQVMRELWRVTKPGGIIVASMPFIYNEHGSPFDYRRYSRHGAREIFLEAGWQVIDLRTQGGVGSSVGLLFLNWFDSQLNNGPTLRIVKGIMLPISLAISFVTNMLSWMWDKIDSTHAFYSNVLIVAKK